MVEVRRGTLLTCDPAIKEYLIHLEETGELNNFIMHNLDEQRMFVRTEQLVYIQKKIDELMKQNTFPVGQTNNLSGQGKA